MELPVICDAADFIVKTTRQELVKTTSSERATSTAATSTAEDREENELSYESSTSSDDDNTQSPRASSSNRPRITRETLENAVRGAAQSNNSLSNIAQRQQEASDGSGSSSRSSILPTDLSNAIARAMSSFTAAAASSSAPSSSSSSSTSSATTTSARTAENPPLECMETLETASNFTDLPEMYRTHMYAEQMQTMRHMGLTNDSLNLSILMMTNGALENAVHLALAMGDSNPF